jgi:superfamily I DNA/RNA helicase
MSSPSLRGEKLSDEQALALRPAVRHIEAGPGAGKTTTLVARFRERAVSLDAGIALLSFTNAAVDVARSRCLDQPQLLECPNFIGTFDSFFHRYVVTPALIRKARTSPRYVSSWDDLPDDLRMVNGIRLSCWTRDPNGTIRLDESRLSQRERQFWHSSKVKDEARDAIRERGTRRVIGLHHARTYDASEARRLAIRALRNDSLPILTRLARRFGEIIVDEFQDCDDLEHELLRLLTDTGIHVVTVADPDQAIYEFRQVGTDNYGAHVAKIDPRHVVTLATCYRSTPSICSLVTSARQVSTAPVVSNRPETPGAPIQVVVGDGAAAGAVAVRMLGAHGIRPKDARFIAHKKVDARRLAHPASDAITGNAAIPRFLAAVAEIRSGTDVKTRHAAIRRIESTVLGLFAWDERHAPTTRAEQLEKLAMTADQLRVLASRILTAAPHWESREGCAASVRAIIEEGAAAANVALVQTLGQRLAKPSPDCWTAWIERNEDLLVPEVERVRWTHVHAVKGAEFDAVIYALPPRAASGGHVLDDWQSGLNTEARRVLYVGMSRARKLVVLVVPQGARATQLKKILTRDGVPHDVTVTG